MARSVMKSLSALVLLLAQRSNAQSVPTPYASPTGFANDISSSLEASASSNAGFAKQFLFDNIDVSNAANGTVIAAQSYSAPNYAYNWVRDASLTMDVVQQLYAAASSDSAKASYAEILFAYANARVAEQKDPNLQTGLGEPKFDLDNSVFTGAWGRPQNDGPATSATTLINFANAYMSSGGSASTVQDVIYNAPVKADLLFVASNWSSPSFDIWEEESGYHFYNRLVSHRALVSGADFATKMGKCSSCNQQMTPKAVAGQMAFYCAFNQPATHRFTWPITAMLSAY